VFLLLPALFPLARQWSSGEEVDLKNLRLRSAVENPIAAYGLLAVAVVASVQIYFSLRGGGYFIEQWSWGASAIAAALVGAALIRGYFSTASLGRWQWALVGALVALVAIVTVSISWSIAPVLSFHEASRTAMYAGTFVLLLPAVAYWGSLVVDLTLFGALLPPAIYGLQQKILPTSVKYTGIGTLATDPKVSSTVGYHPAFGMMCAMGVLLAISRVGAFRSLRSIPLRALYSATGTMFLVALYFSFSRGAVVALAAGVVVLLVLSKHRFEVLGNAAISGLPALWVVSQARELSGLVSRPVSPQAIQSDGLALVEPLLKGLLLAFAAQLLFFLLVLAVKKFAPEGVRRGVGLAATVIAAGAVVVALGYGAATFQKAGGVEELKDRITADSSELEARALKKDQTQRLTSVSAANRIVLWQIAWENFRQHPLTGTGGDTYQLIFEQNRPDNYPQSVLHPHSVWLSLLSDTGIFSFLAFATFSAGCLCLAFYNAFSTTSTTRSRALLAGSAAAITAYLASSTIDWNWYIPASTLPFFALAAVAAGTTPRRRERNYNGAENARRRSGPNNIGSNARRSRFGFTGSDSPR
jgi:O-Antigen ligase